MKVSLYISIIALSLVTFNLSGQIRILIEPTQLGDSINSKSEEANPLLSPDGSTLFFVRTFSDNNVGGRLAGQDIWYSKRKSDSSWTFPKNLSELNNRSNNVVIGFSQQDSLIYVLNTYSSPLRWKYGVAYSTFVNDVWTNPKELNLKFNIKNAYRNYYMSTSEDVLLISTDSKDSYGNEDIYIYYKKGEKWHGPVHLNQNINSEASEISPFLSSDKEVLFFASNGHGGYGDMDIFMSKRLDSTWANWSQPVNLGEQINTSKFDAYFSTYAEGESFFVSNSDGHSNIYYTVLNYDFDDRSLEKLRYLMTLELSDPADENQEVEIEEITTNSFSFNSEVAYYFDIFKLDEPGAVKDSVRVELSPNVQYNFNRYDDGIDYAEMAKTLNSVKGLSEGEASSKVVLLSKRLNLQEDETYVFNLKPVYADTEGESVIITDEKAYHLNVKEPKRIIFKMENLEEMSIQTDMAYLQSQTQPVAGNFEADTDDFFEDEDNEVIEDEGIKYRVQIAASRQELSKEKLRRIYTGNRGIKMHTEDGWYKYYIADDPSYFEARQILNDSNVDRAFIVAYTQDSEKVDLQDAFTYHYQKRKIERDNFVSQDSVESEVKVHFEFDKYVLEPDVCAYLDQKVVASLQQNKNLIAVVNGHTDIRGSNTYNYILSKARATYVKDYILSKGIEETRVRLKFFGETRAIGKCHEISDCEEHIHDANRRVEILLIQLAKNYIPSG